MKNVEFYANELADLAVRKNGGIAIKTNDGVPCDCNDLNCGNCLFGNVDGCEEGLLKWAESEYVEYEVDWEKVPVDTPVYCQANICQNESPGYFAKFNNGIVYTWRNGRTSFTSLYKNDICSCQFVRLAESHPEWMKRKEK